MNQLFVQDARRRSVAVFQELAGPAARAAARLPGNNAVGEVRSAEPDELLANRTREDRTRSSRSLQSAGGRGPTTSSSRLPLLRLPENTLTTTTSGNAFGAPIARHSTGGGAR